MPLITMTNKELERYSVIKRLIKKDLKAKEAASQLRLSIRQTQRIKLRVKTKGAKGVIHGNRGHISNNKIPDEQIKRITNILKERYYDFGPTLASEKLNEEHNLKYDPKTIRKVMIKEGLWTPRKVKAKTKHRSWRERKAAYGEMIQFDGSYDYWLGKGQGEICLLATIDDATGSLIKAKLAADEGVLSVFSFWQEYLKRHGKPLLIYLDKFSTYHQNQGFTKDSNDTLTQFQRAMVELRIEVISANSPQAKGRVERLFKTLQDRLIKELRLAGITTIKEANEFVEKKFINKFNKKFTVEAREKNDLHRKLIYQEEKKLETILSRQTTRVVLNDFTVEFRNKWYQLTEEQKVTIRPRERVIMEERTDGALKVRLKSKYLNYIELPAKPQKGKNKVKRWVIGAGTKIPRKPSLDHPWRKPFMFAKKEPIKYLITAKV